METNTPNPADRVSVLRQELRLRFEAHGPMHGIEGALRVLLFGLFMCLINLAASIAARQACRDGAGAAPGRLDADRQDAAGRSGATPTGGVVGSLILSFPRRRESIGDPGTAVRASWTPVSATMTERSKSTPVGIIGQPPKSVGSVSEALPLTCAPTSRLAEPNTDPIQCHPAGRPAVTREPPPLAAMARTVSAFDYGSRVFEVLSAKNGLERSGRYCVDFVTV